MSARFLNVDLEIEAPLPLNHLCAGFVENGADQLYQGVSTGGYLASFEVDDGWGSDPNTIIWKFCDIIDGFDEALKSDWSGAHSRTFDLGYEADSKPGSFHSDLKNEVVRRVALLGADIRITLYPRRPEKQLEEDAITS